MDEIDAKLAIYRWNLGQNSRWNLKLPFKINFGRWITIWKQSGRWISLLTLGFKSGRWINMGVIWAVRSRWRERGDFSPKIGNISPINRRHTGFSGDFFIKSPIYRRYIADFLAIFCEKSPGRLISSICRFAPHRHAIYRRYFAYFFRFFPPWYQVN